MQYWTGEDPIKKPAMGVWQTFPGGAVPDGKGGAAMLQLASAPVSVQCGSRADDAILKHLRYSRLRGSAAIAWAMPFAKFIWARLTSDGKFHDLIRHTPDQDQTATFCSSVDPWHEPADLDEHAGDQVGFDLFFTSGVHAGICPR